MRGLANAVSAIDGIEASTLEGARDDYTELRRRAVVEGPATDEQFARAVSRATGVPYLPLLEASIDSDVIALVPGNVCRRHSVLPLAKYPGSLLLGMLDPTDLLAIDDVATLTDLPVDAVVVAADALRVCFDRYLRSDDELSDLSQEISESLAPQAGPVAVVDETDADAPVIRFVNLLISQAVNDRASDIHLEPGEERLTVRFRIDGVLHVMQTADSAIQDGVISRLKIMAQLDIAERRRPQDGRLSVRHEGRTIDVRVATLPTVWGEKVVMRILDASGRALSLRDMDFSDENDARVRAALDRPHGMILATGPTGSGKSTSLYASLRTLINPRVNVITVEDPVEYRIAGANQIQVNARAGLTFDAALRSILRADPDVILVGEIRDRETAAMSIEAALTGHLVLSTLHTNDAPSALTRLVEMGIEPYLVSSSTQLVLAQRLARRLCSKCSEPFPDAMTRLASVGAHLPEGADARRAVGCPHCAGTGYRGRLALHEVMPLSNEIESQIVQGALGSQVRELALAEGMIPLRDDGWLKVARGLTTIEEVLRVTV